VTNAEIAMVHTASAGTLQPYRVDVPDELARRIDRLVEVRQGRTGECAEVARRQVESLIWLLGVNSVERMVER
jgi:hypothetical protein